MWDATISRMSKSMYDMNAEELAAFIQQQEREVEKLTYERPGSKLLNFEAGILKDAKKLLEEKHRKALEEARI